jgi:cytochrome c2
MIRPAAIVFSILTLSLHAEVTPGEILFSEMNCVACHVATKEIGARLASRPAPRLGPDGVKLTPQWIQEFLADPQKTKPNTLMPDMLHGLPTAEKADAVEALTHFLVSSQGEAGKSQVGASAAKIAAGERLFHEVGCAQCHAPTLLPEAKKNDAAVKEELAKLQSEAVPLAGAAIAKKYTVAELAKFLRDPLKSRPGGRMPSLNLDSAESEAIAMWLLREQMPAGKPVTLSGLNVEYYEKDFPELPQFDRITPTSTGAADMFTVKAAKRRGNFALRFRGNIDAPKDGRYKFYTTSDDGSRLAIDGKVIVDNGGIHPAQERSAEVDLKAGVHSIEVQYFDGGGQVEFSVKWKGPGIDKQEIPAKVLSHDGQPMVPAGEIPFVVDKVKAQKGAALFVSQRCNQCHASTPNPYDLSIFVPAVKQLAEMRMRAPMGCLAPNPKPTAPKFQITDRQRTVMLAFLQNQDLLGVALTPEEHIRRTMLTLNCYACHNRDKRGGIEGLRKEYLTSLGEADLGDEGRVPPTLVGVGAKLRVEWMRELLAKGTKARPYMATRMPAFGEANVGHLPALLEKVDVVAEAQADPNNFTNDAATQAKWGRKLIGTGGISCIACHTFAGNKSLGIPAMDLSLMSRRLKYDWFRRYLLDPQALRPGTRMPPFWPGGVAVNKDVLKGDTEGQIRALWLYLARQNFTDLPDGLVQGKLEIAAQTEAAIYRNFIAGGGPRAIGVGYPEKANLCFDANELRLAMIWQGPFIDAARHRSGRGEGFEKPLGRNVQKLVAGPAFAVLASESDEWPKAATVMAGAPFKGYRLDDKQRPAFRYQSAGFDVEDYPVAMPGEADAYFQRTLTVRGATPTSGRLYFRAATGPIKKDGDAFVVDEKLRLKFPGTQPLLRGSGDKAELLVPVPLSNGAGKLVEEIVW